MALVATGWRPAPVASARDTVAIVVAARPIAAGQQVTLADIGMARVGDEPAIASVLHAASQAVGRSARVPIPSGVPLMAALLFDQPPPGPGQRRVGLHLDQAAVPPGLQPGDGVDVLAAVADVQSAGGGRVMVVARARIVGVQAAADGAAPNAAGDAVTLDVGAEDVERVLWAEAFAKSLRLLVRPAGDTSAGDSVGAISP